MLQHGRSKGKTFSCWVDALCINQEDVEEKGQHVEMMASIYRRATEVAIWLGLGDPLFRDALRIASQYLRDSTSQELPTPSSEQERALVHIITRPVSRGCGS
ncbi:hypothetical protein LTR53_019825, partial [Teratosphaeriaceae sp. CCFEE 6253]